MPEYTDGKFIPEVGDFAYDATSGDKDRRLMITNADDETFWGVWYGADGTQELGELKRENAIYSDEITDIEPYSDFS